MASGACGPFQTLLESTCNPAPKPPTGAPDRDR
jgi:hypothetical protein